MAIALLGSFGLSSFGADIQVSNCTVEDLGVPTLSLFPVNSTYANARSVWGIAEYEDRIYVGCGNFDTNAGSGVGGSLPVYSYDTATGEWTEEYSVKEEQISRFFTEWGNLYIPSGDPTSGSYVTVYCKGNGVWDTIGNVCRAEHIFDMLFMEDGKTAFAGIDPYTSAQPYVARTVNGGSTWTKVYFRKNGSVIKGTSGVFYRTYNLFEYEGEVYATLYVSSTDLAGNMGLYKYNSATGTMDYYAATHENLYKNYMTVGSDFTFNGSFVNVYNGFYVFSDDLTTWEERTDFLGTPVCAQVIGNAVYMTSYSGTTSYIYKTTDLETFILVGALKLPDSYVASFTYHEGTFYLGTSWYYPESETNGSVLAMKLTRQGCTHKNLVTELIPDTCYEDGLQTDSCPDCGYLAKTVISCTGHSYPEEWTMVTSPSCTENGLEERLCERCGEKEGRTTPALGHLFTEEYIVDQPLTCTSHEQKSRHCVRCEEITDVITTPAPGHRYVNNVCTVCRAYEPFRPGDCSGDTLVNILDMTLAARYIAQQGSEGTFDLSACDMTVVDFNGDGVIDQLDLNLIAELILSEK